MPARACTLCQDDCGLHANKLIEKSFLNHHFCGYIVVYSTNTLNLARNDELGVIQHVSFIFGEGASKYCGTKFGKGKVLDDVAREP